MVRSGGWKCACACFALIFLIGCLQTPPAALPQEQRLLARNNAVSLLYSLLGDEKNVSKLLIIKRDREELNRVIKHIASVCGQIHSSLARMAKEDSSLNLRDTALPVGEAAARESASKARSSELLRASGDEFEFQLLLTQIEALGYAKHLGQVAAANEPHPQRAREFFAIRDQLQQLHDEALSLLKSRRTPPAVKQ